MQSYTKFASAHTYGGIGQDSESTVQAHGPERTVILIDNSGSMEELDYPPSRLAAGIAATMHLLEIKAQQTPKDQAAIITFSSSTVIQTPMLPVCDAMTMFKAKASMLQTESSTNITAGLKTAQSLLGQSETQPQLEKGVLGSIIKSLFEPDLPQARKPIDSKSQDRVILLTDGAANDGGCPLRMAKQLKNRGVCIDVIGIGGSPDVVDRRAPKIASTYPDGSPRYCFIGDTDALIKEFGRLAGHIKKA